MKLLSMKHVIGMMTGISKKVLVRWRGLLMAFACVGCLAACEGPKETITDVYYIHNRCSQLITIDFGHPLFWDTCSAGSTATHCYVRYESEQVELPSGQIIRLHPVCRKAGDPLGHQPNALFVLGVSIQLITSDDTIQWYPAWKDRLPDEEPCMFDNDSVWSIYNVSNWQTIQDENLPYTYYHTFSVTEKDIEMNKAL